MEVSTKKYIFTGVFNCKTGNVSTNEIWEYFNDEVDFKDNSILSQPLGNWHKSIFYTDIEEGKYPSLPLDNKYICRIRHSIVLEIKQAWERILEYMA